MTPWLVHQFINLITLALVGLKVTHVIVNSSWKSDYLTSKYTYVELSTYITIGVLSLWGIYFIGGKIIIDTIISKLVGHHYGISYLWYYIDIWILIAITIFVYSYRRNKLHKLSNFNYGELIFFVIISIIYVYLVHWCVFHITGIARQLVYNTYNTHKTYDVVLSNMWYILQIFVSIVLASIFLDDSSKFKKSTPIILWQMFIIVILTYQITINVQAVLISSIHNWFRIPIDFLFYTCYAIMLMFLLILQLTYLVKKEKSLLSSYVRCLISGVVSILIIRVIFYIFDHFPFGWLY